MPRLPRGSRKEKRARPPRRKWNNNGGSWTHGKPLCVNLQLRMVVGSGLGMGAAENAVTMGASCCTASVKRSIARAASVRKCGRRSQGGPLGVWGRQALMYLVGRVHRATQRDYMDLLWFVFGIVTSVSTVGEAMAVCRITLQARMRPAMLLKWNAFRAVSRCMFFFFFSRFFLQLLYFILLRLMTALFFAVAWLEIHALSCDGLWRKK